MRIRESKDLKFDIFPFIFGSEGGRVEPELSILERYERADDKLVLYFKNGSHASIKGINVEGGREIDMIELKIMDLIGKNYKEILDSNII